MIANQHQVGDDALCPGQAPGASPVGVCVEGKTTTPSTPNRLARKNYQSLTPAAKRSVRRAAVKASAGKSYNPRKVTNKTAVKQMKKKGAIPSGSGSGSAGSGIVDTQAVVAPAKEAPSGGPSVPVGLPATPVHPAAGVPAASQAGGVGCPFLPAYKPSLGNGSDVTGSTLPGTPGTPKSESVISQDSVLPEGVTSAEDLARLQQRPIVQEQLAKCLRPGQLSFPANALQIPQQQGLSPQQQLVQAKAQMAAAKAYIASKGKAEEQARAAELRRAVQARQAELKRQEQDRAAKLKSEEQARDAEFKRVQQARKESEAQEAHERSKKRKLEAEEEMARKKRDADQLKQFEAEAKAQAELFVAHQELMEMAGGDASFSSSGEGCPGLVIFPPTQLPASHLSLADTDMIGDQAAGTGATGA